MFHETEVIEYLLQNGINPNESTNESHTVLNLHSSPLHLAAEQGHLDAVNLLLRYGADVEARDSDGATALEKASSEGHDDVVKLLWHYGADFEAKGSDGATALEKASSVGHGAAGNLPKVQIPAKL